MKHIGQVKEERQHEQYHQEEANALIQSLRTEIEHKYQLHEWNSKQLNKWVFIITPLTNFTSIIITFLVCKFW